jgi:hypothetical protein
LRRRPHVEHRDPYAIYGIAASLVVVVIAYLTVKPKAGPDAQ